MSQAVRFLFILFAFAASCLAGPTINTPAGIEHTAWDSLLKKYVNALGLVNYKEWSQNQTDRQALQNYIAQFSKESDTLASFDEEVASLTNAYNAFTIEWMLQNYPIQSIKKTSRPWKEKRWNINGQLHSLDNIEHDNLRPMIGWKVHSIVVCAARSCPPLRTTAFTADNYNALVDEAYRDWFARTDLNQYLPESNQWKLSRIFKWYKKDFKGEYSIRNLLALYAPAIYQADIKKDTYKVRYLKYDWGLNDQGTLGRNYKGGFF